MIKHRLAVGSLVCLLIASVPGLRAQEPASIFITLGTQAGPGADKLRSQPASLLIAGDQIILIDAGDGAAEQLAKVDVPLAKIRTILISHTHFDHIGGLFALLGMRYQTQTSERLTIYGPPGIKRVVEGLIEAMRASVVAKANMRGSKPDDTIDIREIGDGSTVSLGPIRITVAENSHYSATFDAGESTERSLSYRFALADRTIVYTGDTGPSENVERLAAGDIVADFSILQRAKFYRGGRQRSFHAVLLRDRHRGQHLVCFAGQAPQQALRMFRIVWFAEDLAVEHDRRISGEQRMRRQLARRQLPRTQLRLGAREPHDISVRCFTGERCLVNVRALQLLERNAELLQQFTPPRAARGKVNSGVASHHPNLREARGERREAKGGKSANAAFRFFPLTPHASPLTRDDTDAPPAATPRGRVARRAGCGKVRAAASLATMTAIGRRPAAARAPCRRRRR